ncbi:MAG: sugar phosphate nucleotidyltransferase [Myxococcota bacterium]|jgi:mannose-1-phosphate guanylyltransferase|nr:sugar phosphate nucleotidyltransferase [Myxococcota bacterium]
MSDTDLSAIVMGAGFGNRLRPLTDELPKPACPLMGVPLAGYALARLHRAGLREITVNAHHLAPRLVERLGVWAAAHLPDLELRYSVEVPEILGTGGALVAARPLMGDGPRVVVNGDILCDFDLATLLDRHRSSRATATLLLADHPEVERFGAVVVDGEGRIVDLAGLAARRGDASGGPAGSAAARGVFTGVHLLEPEVFDHLPGEGKSCVVRQGYVPLMAAGRDLRGVVHRGQWNDLGTAERYLGTHIELLDAGYPRGAAQQLLWEGPPPPGVQPAYAVDVHGVEHGDRAALKVSAGVQFVPPLALFRDCRLGAGAVVGPHAVIGARATVEGRAVVQRSVVWADAHVAADRQLDRAIVFRHGKRNRVVDVGE